MMSSSVGGDSSSSSNSPSLVPPSVPTPSRLSILLSRDLIARFVLVPDIILENSVKETFSKKGAGLSNEERIQISRRVLGCSCNRRWLLHVVEKSGVEEGVVEEKDGKAGENSEESDSRVEGLKSAEGSASSLEAALTEQSAHAAQIRAGFLLLAYMIAFEESESIRRQETARILEIEDGRLRRVENFIHSAELSDSLPEDPTHRLAVQHSLPDWMAESLVKDFGVAVCSLVGRVSNEAGPTHLRVNTLKTDRETLQQRLLESDERVHTETLKWSTWGLSVPTKMNVWGNEGWRGGEFEVQDEGSQLIAQSCVAKPGERWLDLCAGSGGKTLGLAAAMQNEGVIVACDVDRNKLDNLKARCKRAGVSIVEVVVLSDGEELETLTEKGHCRFDGILVDAPCSQLGILRRHPSVRFRLKEAEVELLPALQIRLLRLAESLVCPSSGRVVYATCTLRRKENEDVVSNGSLTTSYECVTLLPNLLQGGQGGDSGLPPSRLLPDYFGDGFFIACSVKGGLENLPLEKEHIKCSK
uniref:SAM-dependent MTase RsmB/NOP-type domain-containing protein n=1 Tax=Chromera velia CCMP2878 TaxID=1169474 RepID=A0A0G4H392_9ALVE|eukprot:Cvel_24497.t1-p1 / transcript=Cvel_24497.t1 / gene=Cvel_24497 / organism=Chromera_velia_CCMP2878 / gene_product=Ribosomal RNA small subunit methyltransferase B, putative / transcript_product=Ribosomal RNA small subunit methyltransferase B, putative / location=Cvel_scaffold2656:16111-17694(-) / protein_length=528 / sequence_SO=supercontig / SO=protein_coding / is_pseudo=false